MKTTQGVVMTVASRITTIFLLAFVFITLAFRARTQSITHDEAITYEWYLDGGVGRIFAFGPANHVLQTFLAKFCVKVFGTSELSLRIPSLAGALIYLAATYALCKRLFGNGLLFVLGVAMLCLNPLIMDYLILARGYGLGLAFLVASMYFLARMAGRETFDPDGIDLRWECIAASVLLALSVASNLTYLVPAVGLALSFCAVVLGAPDFKEFNKSHVQMLARDFILPGASVGAFIMWPFLIQARPGTFYTGLSKLSDGLRDSFNASFLYKWTEDINASLGASPPLPGSWEQRISDLGIYVLLPSLFLFVLLGFFFCLRIKEEPATQSTVQCRLFGGAAIISCVLTALLHIALKVNYPPSRGSLYFIPLFTISGILMGREFSLRFRRAHLNLAGVAIAAMILLDYTASLHTRYFRTNNYDVISRQLFQSMSDDARRRGLSSFRVGGTWWYEPEINFYRRRYNFEPMSSYDTKDRSYFWESPNSLASPADYDYYVFTSANDPGLKGARVTTLFQDAAIGVTVIANGR